MLEHAAHNWRKPRLYHLVLTGATEPTYTQLLLRLCRKVRSAGAEYNYKACLETDTTKGLHCHVMLVLSTTSKPERFITKADESGKTERVSLLRQVVREVQTDCPDLKVRVQPPASQPVPYIEFNQTNNELLNEAVEWCSYIFKARSKPQGRCYLSSRPARRACKVNVGKDVTPLIGVAKPTVSKPKSKNIHFPTSPEGKKCRKRPVYKGLPYVGAAFPSVQPLKTWVKQHETGRFSRFIDSFQLASKGVYNGVKVVRRFYTSRSQHE